MTLEKKIKDVRFGEFNIALLMDGPNMFTSSIYDVEDAAKKYGKVMINEIFLSKETPTSFLEFFIQRGYVPVLNSLKDVDTSLAIRACEIICSPKYGQIDLLAIVAKDADYLPLVQKTRLYDKKMLVIGGYEGMSMALRNNADYFEAARERVKE